MRATDDSIRFVHYAARVMVALLFAAALALCLAPFVSGCGEAEAQVASAYVRRSGDTMSGPLVLAGTTAPALSITNIAVGGRAIQFPAQTWLCMASDVGCSYRFFLNASNVMETTANVFVNGALEVVTSINNNGFHYNGTAANGGTAAFGDNLRGNVQDTASTWILGGAITAVAATTTTGAVAIQPVNALDADDAVFLARDNASALRLRVDFEGDTTISGRFNATVQTVTVADNALGTNAAFTLTPSSSHITIACNDAQGCDATLSETGAVDGSFIYITYLTAGVLVNFTDTAAVTELAGAFAAGQYDTLTLLYVSDRWVEVARSNN